MDVGSIVGKPENKSHKNFMISAYYSILHDGRTDGNAVGLILGSALGFTVGRIEGQDEGFEDGL